MGTAVTTTSRSPRDRALDRLRAPRFDGWLEALPLVLIVIAAAAFAARWSLAADEWRVMTDEMQYLKLAQNVSETLSPMPHLRGESYASYSQLFPILLSPALWLFDVPVRLPHGHALNALLMASTAVPTYLLARLLVASGLPHSRQPPFRRSCPG